MKTKNIKVVYTYRHHQSGGILHSGTGPCTAVPKIQMEGHWLEALGFSIGAPLIVEYEEGSIHIRTLTAEELAAKRMEKIMEKPTFEEVCEKFYALAKFGAEEIQGKDIVLQLAEKAIFEEIKNGVIWK